MKVELWVYMYDDGSDEYYGIITIDGKRNKKLREIEYNMDYLCFLEDFNYYIQKIKNILKFDETKDTFEIIEKY